MRFEDYRKWFNDYLINLFLVNSISEKQYERGRKWIQTISNDPSRWEFYTTKPAQDRSLEKMVILKGIRDSRGMFNPYFIFLKDGILEYDVKK